MDNYYISDDVFVSYEKFIRNLLDPEIFGHSVSKEVRNEARRLLGMKEREK